MTNLPLAGASYTAKKLLPVVQKAAVERIAKDLSSLRRACLKADGREAGELFSAIERHVSVL